MRLVLLSLALTLAAVGAPAEAQQVERGFRLDRDAAIRILNLAGTITVRGWDRDSVAVSGNVPAAEAILYAGGSGGAAKLGIEPRGTTPPRVDLQVMVPRNARVWIKTDAAVIDVAGVAGQVDASSVGGRVQVAGPVRTLSVESMDGTIAVEGEMTWVRLKSAGGSVRFLGSAEDLVASSVSGAVGVDARRLARARVETVTGGVRIAALPDRTGSISVESHAGTVELLVPPGAPALFELATLGGTITNGLTATRPHPGPGGRGQELSFGTDPSGAVITARTFKGDILVGRTEGLASGKK
ncbi:MAG TPA: hypothetical protein VJ773_02110 [Gemmatimonadales bacterium]|nr:hypothetical protein [Gemmatimonadales bacterium]